MKSAPGGSPKPPGAVRKGEAAPVGQRQHTPRSRRVTRPRQRRRTCLRKGCGRVYSASRWNQRYCQEPECRRLVLRWQAASWKRGKRHMTIIGAKDVGEIDKMVAWLDGHAEA